MLKTRKEKADEYHPTYNPDPVVIGSPAGLAVQPKLGIRRQRDRWVPLTPDYPGPVVEMVLGMPRKRIIILVDAGSLPIAACIDHQPGKFRSVANF